MQSRVAWPRSFPQWSATWRSDAGHWHAPVSLECLPLFTSGACATLWDAVKLPVASGGFWPIPGLPGLLWKLTMAGRARVSKVSLLARLRTHAPGQKRLPAKDGYLAAC